jgi:hypothetical protein
MALPARTPTSEFPSVLPPAEARAMFDGEARRVAGLSGDEFIQKWEAGEFDEIEDSPDGREISYLVMLIPFGRQNP